MKQIYLTPAEQDRLEDESERRGITVEALITLLVAKQLRPATRLAGVKSNGWSRFWGEFVPSAPTAIPKTRAAAPAYRPDGPKPRNPRCQKLSSNSEK